MKNTTNLISLPPELRTPLAYAKQPPDESTHYTYNTNFILHNHRLPISGKDDLGALKTCHTNEFGEVPCMYSYTVYPAYPYIFSAITARLGQCIGLQPALGARLPGLVYGLVLLNFLYLASVRITKNKQAALLLAATVSFIPQVIYTISYLNLDGISMAIAAVLSYAIVRYLQNPSLSSTILVGLTLGGMLPTAKYNFFILALPALVALGYRTFTSARHRANASRLMICLLSGFLIIAAFWYVRNYALYGDITGQSFTLHEMSKYHNLGHAKALSLHSLSDLEDKEFIGQSFRSFFAAYGGMLYFISSGVYDILAVSLFGLAAYSLMRAAKSKDRTVLLSFILVVASLIICLSLSMYNSLKFDYQAQGRYIFPVLFPILVYFAYQWKKDTIAFRYLPVVSVTAVAYVYLLGVDLFIRVYL